ncbi:hypothetical protein [Paenibacillus sp. RC67]|uniref:hypothetical protein n=1 Tax=Paenibacillus sp. RC67 TaxID=3039392 RepID=UPI0024ACDBBC|nr:hypothetical protein [Paenibacillus sp. RC67]
MHKKSWIVSLIAVVLFSLGINVPAWAATDFTYTKATLNSMFPDQASVMDALTREKEAILSGEQAPVGVPNGNFETGSDNTEIGNADWGAVALLAYWYHNSGQTDARVAPAANRGINFAIANRDWTTDPADTSALRQTGKGEHWAAYSLNNGNPVGGSASFPTTAWALVFKAMILQADGVSGNHLFTQAQKDTLKTQAYSHWRWLSRVVKYNPQGTPNQVMGMIYGGYLLGSLYNDTNLMNEALAYYNTGVTGSNLDNVQAANCANPSYVPGHGYRECEIGSIQGFNVFFEQGGFETHYSGFQLSFMAALLGLMGSSPNANVQADALSQAQYMNYRLSASGTMHGGTRHNEISGSITDAAVVLGYNYYSAALGSDLGRVRLNSGTISTAGSNSQIYGHRAMGTIMLHQYFSPWVNTQPIVNNNVALRRGNVSIYFDKNNNQPQEISVNGTSFTENMINNSIKAESFYYKDANNVWNSASATPNNYYNNTNNYTMRSITGTDTNSNASIKTRYITNGTSLYHITMVKFNSPITLKSSNVMIGLPNFSNTQRIVNIFDGNNLSNVLDLSSPTASTLTSNILKIGNVSNYGDNVFIQGWPQLKADNNVGSGVEWMSSTNYTQTLEKLIGSNIWWEIKSGKSNIQYTDDLRVNVIDSSSGVSFAAGDIICAVAKFTPQTAASGNQYEAFTVTPTYVDSSKNTVSKVVIDDAGMNLSITYNTAIFQDKASGQQITY